MFGKTTNRLQLNLFNCLFRMENVRIRYVYILFNRQIIPFCITFVCTLVLKCLDLLSVYVRIKNEYSGGGFRGHLKRAGIDFIYHIVFDYFDKYLML